MKNSNILIAGLRSFLVELPTPLSLSYFWNIGSILGFCLGVQLVSGIFLAFHYSASVDTAFLSVIHLVRDVNYGWFVHFIHMNGANLFFCSLYLHMLRGIYHAGFLHTSVWLSGLLLYLLIMVTAFLGYVLPWGQMSFWGASVITNLVSAVPYCGQYLVEWVWGGFSVGNPTLVRVFALHFVLPFVVAFVVVIHLVFLHESGSSVPLGFDPDLTKVEFYPYYAVSDIFGLSVVFAVWGFVVMFMPNCLSDCDNFIPANLLVTPEHIQPEWYFLFAYAILRSIPNKLGGVMALAGAVLVLGLMGILPRLKGSWGTVSVWQVLVNSLVMVFMILTWIGSCPVEEPFILIGQCFAGLYFVLIFLFSTI